MRCLLPMVAVLLLTIPLGGGPVAATTPGAVTAEVASPASGEVQAVFHAYRDALLRGDGAAAAACVDSDTFAYFEELRSLAVSGDEETVRSRPFVDRLLVVSMRQVLAPDELERLELGELMERAVAEGWISRETVSQLDIGAVTVDGDVALADAVSTNPLVELGGGGEGAGEPVRYRFVREEGEWKFGFASLVRTLNRLVEEFTAELGTDQDELIFVLVQSLTGRPVLPEVWQAPTGSPP